jgi:ABC-2 type transport system permease protein
MHEPGRDPVSGGGSLGSGGRGPVARKAALRAAFQRSPPPAGGRARLAALRRSFRRAWAIASKEALHIWRDPRTLYLGLGMPLMQILIFGFGIRFDVDHVRLAILDQDHTAASRQVTAAFTASEDFALVASPNSEPDAESMLRAGSASGVLVLPQGLGRDLARGELVPLQLLVDGSDGNATNQVLTKAAALGQTVGMRLAPRAVVPPVRAVVWTRFNPTGESSVFLVPGLMAFVLAMGAVVLTSLSVAREWERGSMEQLFATPVGRGEIVVGKLAPYLALGTVQATLVLAAGCVVFDVPIKGSLLLVAVAVLLFMLGMLGQGLLISVVTRNQMVATQMSMQSSMLPSMLLSGFMFPVQNMPYILQIIAAAVPARWFVSLLRAVLLKGDGLDVVWPHLLGLFVFAALMITWSTTRFQRRLA